jgi:hypothetical protein
VLTTTFAAHPFGRRQLLSGAAAASLVDREEVLVADPRGRLTPAQMVDQKLQALLESCPRSHQPVHSDPRTYVQHLRLL